MNAFLVTILLSAAAFLLALVWWFLELHKVKKILGKYPMPPTFPFLGHAHMIRSVTDIMPVIEREIVKYPGRVVVVMLGNQPRLGIAEHKGAEFLLRSNSIIKKSYEYKFFHPWLGTGLLTSWGDKWRRQRKLLTPAFHFQILEQFIEIFDRQSDILVERLLKEEGGGPFDIFPYIILCALDAVCEAAMGTSVNAQKDENSPYVRSVKEMCNLIVVRTISPRKVLDVFYKFTNDFRKQHKALEILHGYTNRVIGRRRQELINDRRITQTNDGTGIKKRLAFLDLLLQYSFDNAKLSDENIREEVDTFMFGGHDTTTSGISFTLYNLSKHPEIQERVVEELRTIFADDKSRSPTYQDLQDMKYLDMVIKETLRLYPPVPVFSRVLEEDAEYDGGILPKGLTLSIYVPELHRDPAVFPDPEKFDPERFSPENSVGRSPYAYVPFSAGPRNCIGQRFAVLKLKSTVSKILRNFELMPVEDHTPRLCIEVILKSTNGLPVRLKKREF